MSVALLGLLAVPVATNAQNVAAAGYAQPTFADLVDLSDRSTLVVHAEIRRQTRVKAERAPDLAPGFARLYIQAETIALISGSGGLGESLDYLIDVPLQTNGKPPKLKKQQMLLFAREVPGRPGTLQLAGPEGQLTYSPELVARVRPILTARVSPDSPPVVSGIKDALAVQGTLVGESETQIFLDTMDRSPVSISVIRRPGQPAAWGVSWGEIIDSSARPPAPETLRWFRLACSLPERLPTVANLSQGAAARRIAAEDYRLVIDQLGPCERQITQG
ncbi:MAG: hypothetical protein AAGK02_07885 [Pseudomonadota bacterium]